MFELIKLLFDICLFKKGPQDLPSSLWLFRALVIVNVCVSFLMISLQAGWFFSLLQALVSAVLIVGFGWLMLYMSRKRQRFYQTTTALLGTDALISLFALPGMGSMMTGKAVLLSFIITLALMLWHWTVTGHIIRNASGQSWTFSLGLAFLYLLGSYRVMALLN